MPPQSTPGEQPGGATTPGLRRRVARALFIGAAYFAAATVSYAFAVKTADVAVWLPSGLLLAALLLSERRDWPLILVAAFAGNFLADVRHGGSTALALAGAAANASESSVAAWLISRFVSRRFTLGTLREVGGIVLGAAVVSNAMTSVVGALVLGHGTLVKFWENWFVWWMGDGIGMLMVAPVILTVAELVRTRARISVAVAVEGAVTLGATAALAHLLLSAQPGSTGIVAGPPYIVFPLLIWVALRLGPWGAATATFVLCLVTTWDAAHITGLFGTAGSSPVVQVFNVYSYLALASLSALVPAAILNERRSTEEELRASELRFRQMAEHVNEVFFVVDIAESRSLFTSPTWSQIWGRPIEESEDRSIWFDAIHKDDRPLVMAGIAAVRKGDSSTVVFRVARPDGTTRWVRARIFPVRDASGAVYRFAGVAEDITELRLSEERFRQAQKMDAIGRLAGGVAHDFNNLLTVILSYSDLLLSERQPEQQQREDIEAIRRAAESAAALTRQLLISSRQEVLQPRQLNLNALVGATGKMLERLIGEHIKLEMRLDATDDTVLADPGRIEQVVVNLAVNARDAMPAGGRLVIDTADVTLPEGLTDQGAVRPAGSYVLLEVSDTGIGMDAETKARAFEPFYTTKERGKGTGLGLSTVYAIVQQSGGFVTVESEVDKGSCFRLYIPRMASPAAAPKPPGASTEAPRGSELVLVVEDEAPIRSMVCDILERHGYRVLAAPDGASALDVASRQDDRIDLLLTDVVMPGMNGRVLAERFAKLHPDSKVLLVSGYTDDEIVKAEIRGAAVHYLGKPFTSRMLATKVREVLDA